MHNPKKLKQKFIILIFGPTAVGKSSFAESLGREIPSQIINCDIGQFYTPLTIGTAKPDWKSSDIKHHLFDIIDEPKQYNVCQYRDLLFQTAKNIWSDDTIPILVGGSGFYLKSLFFPPIDYKMVQAVNKTDSAVCGVELWDMLQRVDPVRASSIEKNDIYRIRRALNIYKETGKRPSELIPVYDFPSNFLLIFLTRDRKELYERIDKRVLQMLDEGWIEEVEGLLSTDWEGFLQEKKLIGYDIIIRYLKGDREERSRQQMIDTIQKKTRNYAKRQITFWKSFEAQLKTAIKEIKATKQSTPVDSKIIPINLTLSNFDLYLKKLLSYLNPLFE